MEDICLAIFGQTRSKNQNIVLRAFKSLQIKNNSSLSFTVYPQGYSIKIVSVNGSKYFFPFDSNQSPNTFESKKKTWGLRTSRYLSPADLVADLHMCLPRLNASQEG